MVNRPGRLIRVPNEVVVLGVAPLEVKCVPILMEFAQNHGILVQITLQTLSISAAPFHREIVHVI